MTALPAPHVLHRALARTWPPAATSVLGPLTLRDGAGGGKRVSAATADGAVSLSDLAAARAAGAALFMLRDSDADFDALLADQGYAIVDPTVVYATHAARIAAPPPPVSLFAHWPPLAAASATWTARGIGPERQAVMARAAGPKAAFLIRDDDRVAGVAFCALDGPVAMLHALEILPQARRRGLARMALRGMADWALAEGADTLALAVTEANAPARALYAGLGFAPVTRYHYRAAPDGA